MENIPLWSVWLALAVVLVVAEMMTATFFLFCFGIGAALACATASVGLPFSIQMSVFVITSAIAVILSRKMAARMAGKPDRQANVDAILGERGVVTETIDPQAGTGRIFVKNEQWRAESQNAETIAANEHVIVTEVRGTRAIVSKEEDRQ